MRVGLLHASVLAVLAGGPCLAADIPVGAPVATPPAWVRSPLPVPAPPELVLRTGDHQGYGRLAMDLRAGVRVDVVGAEGRLRLQVSGGTLTYAGRAPRNVVAVSVMPDGAVVQLAPGARVRRLHMPGKLVIDVLDPPVSPAPPAAGPTLPDSGQPLAAPVPAVGREVASEHAATSPAASAPTGTASSDNAGPAVAPSPMASSGAPAPAPMPPGPVPPPAPGAVGQPPSAPAATGAPSPGAAPLPAPTSPMPAPSAATTSPPGTSQTGQPVAPAVTLAFGAGVGAAAFRRGGEAIVVFDVRRAIDTAALATLPAFAQARVQLLPDATVLRLPLPPPAMLRLQSAPAGWTLTVGNFPAPPPIRPEVEEGRVRLPATAPGRVVSIPDPETGKVLLVASERGGGEAVAVERHWPEFTLLSTWQGIALEPQGDALSLRPGTNGFIVDAGAPGRALAVGVADPAAEDVIADSNRMTRRFAFADLPAEELLQRLRSALGEAADAPAQARTAGRLKAAQAMLALGMGAEAQALLTLAASDDARLAEDADAIGLSAVAALLAGRSDEADGIEDARLSGSDEVALWRSVRAALLDEGSPAAAPVFAATLPLVLTYPAALRDRLLPLAAETLVLGGEREKAQRLLDCRPDDRALDLARAFLARAEGAAPQALALFDRLAGSPDRRVHARAAVAAVELRLDGGVLTVAQAADRLDSLLYAWRGDAQELAVRLRVAELRARSGAWRSALALLRETAGADLTQAWPEQRSDLQARMQQTFAAAMAADAAQPLAPLELVALVQDNADLLPGGETGEALAARLADRLMALDLPRRAEPVLRKLVLGTPPGAARAEIGDRLARSRLAQNDAPAALAALAETAADNLPAPLVESRATTFARAAAAAGNLQAAIAALAPLDTVAADGLRAELLERAADWPAAAAALHAYAARVVPAEGKLDDAQARILLRLAAAAAQAGDDATLSALREHDAPRLPEGQVATMLRLLTEQPVAGVGDLPRLTAETALARDLPAALRSLQPAAHPVP